MNSSSSEMKPRSPVRSQGRSAAPAQDALQRLGLVKNDVTSTISNSHGLNVVDLVLVQPGSIPTTTSGKIRAFGLRRALPGRAVHRVGRLGESAEHIRMWITRSGDGHCREHGTVPHRL